MIASQRGLSLIGFIFVAAVLALLGFTAAQAVPAHSEYFAVQKVLKAVINEIGPNGSKPQYSQAFDRRAQIDDVHTVTGNDIRVQKESGSTVLTIEYEKRQRLGGYVSLVFDFVAKSSAK